MRSPRILHFRTENLLVFYHKLSPEAPQVSAHQCVCHPSKDTNCEVLAWLGVPATFVTCQVWHHCHNATRSSWRSFSVTFPSDVTRQGQHLPGVRAGAGHSLRDSTTVSGVLSRQNHGKTPGSLQEFTAAFLSCPEIIPWCQGVIPVKQKEGKITPKWSSVLRSAIPGGIGSVTGEG